MSAPSMHNDPLTIFEEEHQHALQQLARLERAADDLSRNTATLTHLETIRSVYEFLMQDVRAHNEKEERALFPALGDDAPTSVFVAEHDELRRLEREMGDALNDAGALDRVASISLSIVDLLRAHITREDEVLFPMSRALLGPEGLAVVARRM